MALQETDGWAASTHACARQEIRRLALGLQVRDLPPHCRQCCSLAPVFLLTPCSSLQSTTPLRRRVLGSSPAPAREPRTSSPRRV